MHRGGRETIEAGLEHCPEEETLTCDVEDEKESAG